jgi:hypothetical protein
MIDKVKLISIFNPESYNTVKTLAIFKKTMRRKVNLDKEIDYKSENYNSMNLLDYYIRSKHSTHGLNVVTYSNVISKIMLGIYTKRSFKIEVIKDRRIIYLNNIDDNSNNEFMLDNARKQELYKRAVLTNNDNDRYSLSKIKLGKHTVLVAGKIDASHNKNHINIIIAKRLTYKRLVELYINGIITNTYKVLYGILNKDNYIRYFNAFKITELEKFLSLDVNKGKQFFNKVITEIKKNRSQKFILSYDANKKEFSIK